MLWLQSNSCFAGAASLAKQLPELLFTSTCNLFALANASKKAAILFPYLAEQEVAASSPPG
jgi:hypothetical protein